MNSRQRANETIDMRVRKLDPRKRSLSLERLDKRELLAGDLDFVQSADIVAIEFEIAGVVFTATEANNPVVNIQAGQQIRITGIDYQIADDAPTDQGALAFEIYRRREHGANVIGSFDYTDGRFADPIENSLAIGSSNRNPGVDRGWLIEDVDNRIAVVAIRYVGDQNNIEDRFFLDINSFINVSVDGFASQLETNDAEFETSTNRVIVDSSQDSAANAELGVAIIQGSENRGDLFEIAVNTSTTDANDFANSFIIFDYQNENDFAYAGIRAIADEFVIGFFDGEFNDVASVAGSIELDQVYDLRLAVDGDHVALAVDGVFRLGHDFERQLDDGKIGFGNQRASSTFTDFSVFQNETLTLNNLGQAEQLPAEIIAAREALDVATQTRQLARQRIVEARATLVDARTSINEARSAFRTARNFERSQRQSSDDIRSEARDASAQARSELREAIVSRRQAAAELRSARVQFRQQRQSFSLAQREYRLVVAQFEAAQDPGSVYALNFNHQLSGAISSVSGSIETVAGQLHLTQADGGNSIVLIDNDALPFTTETRFYATLRADAVGNQFQNGFIIFDYQSPNDFKYAAAWAGADRWSIGHFLDGQWNDQVTLEEPIAEGAALDLQVQIQQDHVTLLVAGETKLAHQFDSAVDGGSLGLGTFNAQSRFDQVAVLQLHGAADPTPIDERVVSTDAAMAEMV